MERLIGTQQYIFVTAHTSGIYILVELLRLLEHSPTFILMNMLRQPWKEATPLQRSVIKTVYVWKKRQALVFVEDGAVMDKCRSLLSRGQSLILARVSSAIQTGG